MPSDSGRVSLARLRSERVGICPIFVLSRFGKINTLRYNYRALRRD